MHYHRDFRSLRCLRGQRPLVLEPATSPPRSPLIDAVARVLLSLILLAALGATGATIATSCSATPAATSGAR